MQHFHGIRFGWTLATVSILLGAVSCVHTRYVYVDEHGNHYTNPSQVQRLVINLADKPASGDPSTFEGNWSAPRQALQASDEPIVELVAGPTRSVFGFGRGQVSGLPIGQDTDGPISFELKLHNGVLHFEGNIEGLRASGTASFVFEPKYLQQISEYTGASTGPDDLLPLMANELPVDYVRALHDGGLRYSLDSILKLRRSGVTAQYAIDWKQAGYDLDPDQIVRLRNSGVDPSYAAALQQGGFRLDPAEIIHLRNSGVDSTYAVAMRSVGTATEPSQIIRLRNSGIDTHYARALAAGGLQLSVDELVRLRNSGVTSDYAVALRQAGYDLEVSEIVRLHHAGVDASYATALVARGKENLSVDEIIRLRQRGVSVETIQKRRQ
jgi:hypothetical protein